MTLKCIKRCNTCAHCSFFMIKAFTRTPDCGLFWGARLTMRDASSSSSFLASCTPWGSPSMRIRLLFSLSGGMRTDTLCSSLMRLTGWGTQYRKRNRQGRRQKHTQNWGLAGASNILAGYLSIHDDRAKKGTLSGDLGRLLTVGTSFPNQVSVELGVHTDLGVIHSANLMGQTDEFSHKTIIHQTQKGGLRQRQFFENCSLIQELLWQPPPYSPDLQQWPRSGSAPSPCLWWAPPGWSGPPPRWTRCAPTPKTKPREESERGESRPACLTDLIQIRKRSHSKGRRCTS